VVRFAEPNEPAKVTIENSGGTLASEWLFGVDPIGELRGLISAVRGRWSDPSRCWQELTPGFLPSSHAAMQRLSVLRRAR